MKKSLAFLMILAMAVTAITANGAGETASAADGNFNPTGLPVVNEQVTLRMLAIKGAVMPNWNEMPSVQELEKRTNVKVEWEHIPPANAKEKINLTFAAGDLPDTIIAQNRLGKDDYRYGVQGLLIPLQDLIAEYGPNIQAMYDRYPDTKTWSTTPDGNIYSLPAYHPRNGEHQTAGYGLVVNKTWLDNLDMDEPQTYQEFETMLRAFKTKDPNGNGKADEIPFTGIEFTLQYLFHAFGLQTIEHNLHVGADNKLLFAPSMDEYKDAVIWLNRLFEDGLLDQEILLQDQKQYYAKGKNPDEMIVGSYVEWHRSSTVGSQRAVEDYVNILPLEGPTGDRFWPKWRAAPGFSIGYLAFTSDNEMPEVTMRWINEAFEPELCFWLQRGMEGQTWEWQGDKRVKFSPPEGMGEGEFYMRAAPVWFFPHYYVPEIYDTVVQSPNVEIKNAQVQEYLPYVAERKYPASYYLTEDTEKKISRLQPDIDAFVQQKQAEWIVNGGIEDEWDDFQATLKKMGIDELMATYDDVFTSFYGD